MKMAENQKYSVDQHLLIAMWTCQLYQKLLCPMRDTSTIVPHSETNGKENLKSIDEEILNSVLGLPVWSDGYFCDDPELNSEQEIQIPVTCIECMRSLDGISTSDTAESNATDSILPLTSSIEPINSDESKAPARAARRGGNSGRMTINQTYQELSKSNLHQHLLVVPQFYDDPLAGLQSGVGAQPFKVKVHPQVGLLTDIHSHLCEAEVIGLLAGKWDPAAKCLYVQSPFPCTSTSRHDDGSTDVELDPVAELQVREVIQQLGLQVVGWYHSHPKFRPDPSVTDIHNQQQYQKLLRDEANDQEPFIGLIVSTFDSGLPTAVSHHQWFNTCVYTDDKARVKKAVNIPMLLNVIYRSYLPTKFPNRFIDSRDSASLEKFLMLLSPSGELNRQSEIVAIDGKEDREVTPDQHVQPQQSKSKRSKEFNKSTSTTICIDTETPDFVDPGSLLQSKLPTVFENNKPSRKSSDQPKEIKKSKNTKLSLERSQSIKVENADAGIGGPPQKRQRRMNTRYSSPQSNQRTQEATATGISQKLDLQPVVELASSDDDKASAPLLLASDVPLRNETSVTEFNSSESTRLNDFHENEVTPPIPEESSSDDEYAHLEYEQKSHDDPYSTFFQQENVASIGKLCVDNSYVKLNYMLVKYGDILITNHL